MVSPSKRNTSGSKSKSKASARKKATDKRTSPIKSKSSVKKKAKMKTSRRRTARGAPDSTVLIRMYDIGFGDCFLLFVPTDEGTKKVLIDCGSIKRHVKTTAEIVDQVISDVTESDGVPRIDVVIATHRHKDHVDGFEETLWRDVEVKEVWMPWTEDPEDLQARRIRETQHSFALQLHAFSNKLGSSKDLLDFALNALSNEEAMETLHNGFAKQPKRLFLPEKTSRSTTLKRAALPGVTVYVLGPSHDEEVIRDMEPPPESSFLRLESRVSRDASTNTAPNPFSIDWQVEHSAWELSDDDRRAIRSIGEGIENVLAASLDSAVNGTSLVLMFKIGKAHLLFPGDAQWGTWNTILEDPVKRNLLEKTKLYKVGHHGSHNATPVQFVEHTVGKDFLAMIPVCPHGLWKDIPRKPLIQAMEKRTKKIVRSDQKRPKAPFNRHGDWYVETTIPIG